MAFWILGLVGSDGLSGRLVLWLGLAFGLGVKALGGGGGAGISSVGACRDGRREKISGYIDAEVHFVHCIVYDTGRWNTYYTFFLRGWLVFLQL